MLSLSNVSEAMGLFYFDKDDYYSRENSPAESEFVGIGAADLGLSAFDKATYKNLLRGLSPDGKELLTYLKPQTLNVDDCQKQVQLYLARCEKSGLSIPQCAEFKNIFDRFIIGKTLDPFQSQDLDKQISEQLNDQGISGGQRKKIRKIFDQMSSQLKNSNRRAGYDLTFNAPKSVSLQVLVNKDLELLDAHKEAVAYALKEAEKRVIGVRVGGRDNRQYEQTSNIVAATFPHGTSREGDPHLHTHSIVFNFTKRADGKWRAIQNDEIYRQAKLIGLIYQNKLAERAQKLGHNIEIYSNGTFELKGFSRHHLDEFSQRRMQVREASARILYERDFAADLESRSIDYKYFTRYGKAIFKISKSFEDRNEFNIISSTEGHILVDGYNGRKSFEKSKNKYLKRVTHRLNRKGVLKNRALKSEYDYKDLAASWSSRAAKVQLPQLTSAGMGRGNKWGKKLDLGYHEDHVGERSSTWTKLDAEMHAVARNLGKTSFESIQQKIATVFSTISTDTQPNPINDSHELLTNLFHLSTEEQILKMAEFGLGTMKPISDSKELAEIGQRNGFTDGQAGMVKGVLTSKDFMVACLGVAGSGKSFAAKTIKEYIEAQGLKIHGLAPDATSAQALQEKSAINSETIHRYLMRGGRFLNKQKYERHRFGFAKSLAEIGVNRHDLRRISLLLTEEFSGKVFSSAKAKSLQNAVSAHISSTKLNRARLETIQRKFFSKVSEKETVLMIDEASKLSTSLMSRLMKKALVDGNRLVLLGELRQTGAVEAGNPVRNLVKENKLTIFDLPETVRQREGSKIRDVVEWASKSNKHGMAQSIEALENKIVTRKKKEHRIGLAVKEYMKLINRGHRDIMLLSDLNVDRYALTERLRDRLKDAKFIQKAEVKTQILVDRDLTKAQKRCSYYYQNGEIVYSFKDVDDLSRSVHYEVLKVDNDKNSVTLKAGRQKIEINAERLSEVSLFSKDEIQVSVGDTLRWTRNHKGRINKHLVEVKSISKRAVELKDLHSSETYRVDPRNHNFLDYGLVMTVYSSQGHDRERGIFLAESNVSMNSWYTALSRMKKDVLVITDSKEKLLDRISISSTKLNALEFMNEKYGWEGKLDDFKKEADIEHGLDSKNDRKSDLPNTDRLERRPEREGPELDL